MDLLVGSAPASGDTSLLATIVGCSGLFMIFVNGDFREGDFRDVGEEADGGRAKFNVLAVGLRLVIRLSCPSRDPPWESLLPELLKGLPSWRSRPSGDGGSEVTLWSTRPALTIGDKAGRLP